MQVHCRCGQEYTAYDRFPHKIRCHQCGRHFCVLDDGRTIELDDSELAPPVGQTVPPSAVQSAPTLSFKDSSPAICTDATMDQTATPSNSSVPMTKVLADVRLIDLQWEAESLDYVLFPFPIAPTKKLSIIVAIVVIALWAISMTIALEIGNRELLCPIQIGVAVSFFLPVFIYRRAHLFEKAESNWLRRRALAIARSTSPKESS
jgi:hypothetical protein